MSASSSLPLLVQTKAPYSEVSAIAEHLLLLSAAVPNGSQFLSQK